MTNNEIWQIVLAVLTSVGGTSGIIILGIKFSSDIIAKRLEEKYKLKLNKELESYKADMQRKIYVSKVRFDKEFEIYQELMLKTLDMVTYIFKLFPIYDEYKKEERSTLYTERYSKAVEAYNKVVLAINSNAAFIPEKTYNDFVKLRDLCYVQIIDYEYYVLDIRAEENKINDITNYKKCTKRTREIEEKKNVLVKELREYLQSLDVK